MLLDPILGEAPLDDIDFTITSSSQSTTTITIPVLAQVYSPVTDTDIALVWDTADTILDFQYAPIVLVPASPIEINPFIVSTPYQQWTGLTYSITDRFASDFFTSPTLSDNWHPWLGGFFGGLGRFTANPPIDFPDIAPLDPNLSIWTMWPDSYLVQSPDFDVDFYTAYPYDGTTRNILGNHLEGGPGTVTAEGGLKMTASVTNYAPTELNIFDVYGLSIQTAMDSTTIKINNPQVVITATVLSTAIVTGLVVLTFADTTGIVNGMLINDLTNPLATPLSHGKTAIEDPFQYPFVVKSVTSTTVTIYAESAGGPRTVIPEAIAPGDSIQFSTYFQSPLFPGYFATNFNPVSFPGERYYVIGDGIPDGTTLLYTNTPAPANNWVPVTSPGVQNWSGSACSSDGTRMIAVTNGGFIWTSADSGATWTQRATSQNWSSCCSSSDGSTLAAVVQDGLIYLSTDYGVTWIAAGITGLPDAGVLGWTCICSDSTGSILYAGVDQVGVQAIFGSTDGGSTWTQLTTVVSQYNDISCSSTGSVIITLGQLESTLVGGLYGGVWVSTNSGSTWTDHYINNYITPWAKCRVTPDGTKMICSENGGIVYTSADAGTTWVKQFTGPNGLLQSLVFSSDGIQVVVGDNGGSPGGKIYYSSDGGELYFSFTRGGIDTGHWTTICANEDFSVFAIFDGQTGIIYDGVGKILNTVDMSLPATATNTAAIVNFSSVGWASSIISSGTDIDGNNGKMILPATGGFVQWVSKHPDTRFGVDAGVNFYTPSNDPDFNTVVHADISLESGYLESGGTPSAPAYLINFFNLTTHGFVPPVDLRFDFHTWGCEYWPDLAWTWYLDNAFLYSTAAAILSASINGSTLTINKTMPINGGSVLVNQWLRYSGSVQTLYLQARIGSTDQWTIYDTSTGLPANLTINTTTMAVSSGTTASPNYSGTGSYCMQLANLVLGATAGGFHTTNDFTLQPGPFEFYFKSVEMFNLPT